MILKRFRLQIILRIVFIATTMLAAVYLFSQTTSYVAASIITTAAVFQLYGLFLYVDKTNRDVNRLLRSIQYNDFSQTFSSEGRGKSFEELRHSLMKVMDDFRVTRTEKEEHYQYLQTVMQHVGVGLITFREDGSVELINNAAKRLLRVPHLKNIKMLAPFSRKLVGILLQMKSGDKELVEVVDNEELLQLAIYATEFKLRGERYTLASIHDIQNELEEKELEAWQKLTRVLTHEIMNSITPIASLASTAHDLLIEVTDPVQGDGVDVEENITDVQGAVRTIERRSQSLLHFVNAYRSLTRIPKPDFDIFPVAELFENIYVLMQPEMRASGTQIVRTIEPSSLDLTADPKLIEQVLINLVKNAMEAVKGIPDAEVQMIARIDNRGRTIIQVIDNGPGIIEEAIGKIFIPFFTTKKEGSGIGLALSRQIMRQHGGGITVYSEPDTRTIFTLRF